MYLYVVQNQSLDIMYYDLGFPTVPKKDRVSQ